VTGKEGKTSGAGKKKSKPSQEELEERYRVTAQLLAKGLYKGQVKKALGAKYGIESRAAEDYIARAREILLAELNQARDIHKSDALAFYKSIITDPKATVGNKINAQKRIDFILGLHAPTRVAFTDANGRTLGRGEVETAIDNLAEGILGAGAAGEAP
jgi:hypothetical protein